RRPRRAPLKTSSEVTWRGAEREMTVGVSSVKSGLAATNKSTGGPLGTTGAESGGGGAGPSAWAGGAGRGVGAGAGEAAPGGRGGVCMVEPLLHGPPARVAGGREAVGGRSEPIRRAARQRPCERGTSCDRRARPLLGRPGKWCLGKSPPKRKAIHTTQY